MPRNILNLIVEYVFKSIICDQLIRMVHVLSISEYVYYTYLQRPHLLI